MDIRINKFIGQFGFTSRREADKLINVDRIIVNGQKAVMGQKVTPKDRIEIDGVLVENHHERNVISLLINL